MGNVATITGSPTIGTQTFTYNHRDRLTNWIATGINETYTYDFVGNITSKAGIGYSYAHNNQNYGHPAGAGGPYAVRNGGYTYDANGNTLTEQIFSDQRAFTWNTENQPTQISFQGTSEYYTYDADGARIKKVRGNVTTYYIGSIYEEEVALGGGDVPEAPDITTTRSMYMFNGQVVAQRSLNATNTLIYLHSDHLGSVGASTTSAGASLSSQEYDPWGRVRTGGVTQTKYNYTGQKLDDTGLLFYNARYYNPLVGRFTSPDSIVPGASSGLGGAGGTVGAEQNSKLTVDFHEGGFLSSVREENALTVKKGFWFQLSGDDQGKNDPSGPYNPQALSRYSYTLNNPLRYVDPSGHYRLQGGKAAKEALADLRAILDALKTQQSDRLLALGVMGLLGGAILGALLLVAGSWDPQGWQNAIDALQFMVDQLNTFITVVGDDPAAWIDFVLDWDRIDTTTGERCAWCILSYNSVANSYNPGHGVAFIHGTSSAVWFGLYKGNYGQPMDLMTSPGSRVRLQ